MPETRVNTEYSHYIILRTQAILIYGEKIRTVTVLEAVQIEWKGWRKPRNDGKVLALDRGVGHTSVCIHENTHL